MNNHRYHFGVNKKDTFLYTHFKQPGHTKESFHIDILDHAHTRKKPELLEKELFWIKALNTAYPLGLNDSIKNFGYISENINPLEKRSHPYYSIPVRDNRPKQKGHGRKRRRKPAYKCTNSVEQIINSISALEYRNLFIHMRSIPRKEIKMLIEHSSSQEFARLPFLTRYKIYSVICTSFWKTTNISVKNSERFM